MSDKIDVVELLSVNGRTVVYTVEGAVVSVLPIREEMLIVDYEMMVSIVMTDLSRVEAELKKMGFAVVRE
ncbi:hypothetical protein V6E00_07415 [Serratia marcescens]|jgi:hypothetical protein|uniref:hypothetical protein n=1 Tax=Serratia marcescens TaxID=615 RepID=UPI002FDB4B1F